MKSRRLASILGFLLAVYPDPALAERLYKAVLLELGERAIPPAGGVRDQVGRVLYDCIVLGQRVAVAPMPQ